MCGCIYGLVWPRMVSHGLSRSCTIANTIIHGHGTRVSFFKSFKNHTRLSRIHSSGPSVTRIRPRLGRMYVRFTRMANRISRVFCVREALKRMKLKALCKHKYCLYTYTKPVGRVKR